MFGRHKDLEVAVNVLLDHLDSIRDIADAMRETGADFAALADDVTTGDILGRLSAIRSFTNDVRGLEMCLMAKVRQARHWAARLERLDRTCPATAGLFVAGTASLNDAMVALGQREAEMFDDGDQVLPYLIDRALVPADTLSLDDETSISATDDLLVAGWVTLGDLDRLAEAFTVALEAHYAFVASLETATSSNLPTPHRPPEVTVAQPAVRPSQSVAARPKEAGSGAVDATASPPPPVRRHDDARNDGARWASESQFIEHMLELTGPKRSTQPAAVGNARDDEETILELERRVAGADGSQGAPAERSGADEDAISTGPNADAEPASKAATLDTATAESSADATPEIAADTADEEEPIDADSLAEPIDAASLAAPLDAASLAHGIFGRLKRAAAGSLSERLADTTTTKT
ncbi:MAG: hypothetical protein GC150_11775 [Rhizobiales bacterium]|nr:hypothetical protein [Hyphomicrobiales bacterium]